MSSLFAYLERCIGISNFRNPDNRQYHPEPDVFNHLLQVTEVAFKESHDTDLIIAAMLHDIGKADNSHNHEKISCKWLEPYASIKTLWLIKNHMRIWRYLTGEMQRLMKRQELAQHPWLPELIQLASWDKMGRRANFTPRYNKEKIVERLNEAAEKHFEFI